MTSLSSKQFSIEEMRRLSRMYVYTCTLIVSVMTEVVSDSLNDSQTRLNWLSDFYFLAVIFIIFTDPSAQAGYDTRSIFKRSLTGLNLEFSFS